MGSLSFQDDYRRFEYQKADGLLWPIHACLKTDSCTTQGSVGQRFSLLLSDHPYFELAAVGASPRSKGRKYKDAAAWKQTAAMPVAIGELVVSECEPEPFLEKGVALVFSGLGSDIAGEVGTSSILLIFLHLCRCFVHGPEMRKWYKSHSSLANQKAKKSTGIPKSTNGSASSPDC